MAKSPVTPESSESDICVNCGFCCDGTLFDEAMSGPDDTAESFIAIGLTPVDDSAGGKRGFRLPCPHFIGLCSIYASPRPSICGAFRCRLLRSVEKGKYTVSQAQQIVRETKAMREKLLPDFHAMHADAVAADPGAERGDRSLIARLGAVMPMLVRPESGEFRGKYARLLLTVFHLTSRLTNDFLPKSQGGNKGSPHD
jgi:hypothetical protein